MESTSSEPNVHADDALMERQLGYKQELYRGIHGIGSWAIGFGNASSYLSVLVIFTFILTTGGPGPNVWDFFISFVLNMFVAFSMGEICSAFPQAGSVYNWSGQLAPEADAPLASYWAGIANWLGYVAANASWAFINAVFISDCLLISGAEKLSAYAEVGVSLGVLVLWTILSVMRVDNVSTLSAVGVSFQLATLVVLVVGLFVSAPSLNSAEYVFFGYNNDSGWTSQGYVLVISMVASAYIYSQFDGSGHMAEESVNARVTAPMGIIYTIFMSGITGFLALFALLFSMQSLTDAVESEYGNAAIAVIVQVCPYGLQLYLGWAITISVFVSGIPIISTAGRITYALIRDHIFPGQEWLAELDPHTKSPVYCILIANFSVALLLLLPLVNEAAFYSFCSICAFGGGLSVAIPIALKFTHYSWPEFMGTSSRGGFPYGPVSFGMWSPFFELISVIWLVYQSFVLLLPYYYPVTSGNMNYSIVIVGALFLCAHIGWEFSSKHHFKGPLRHAAFSHSSDHGGSPDDEAHGATNGTTPSAGAGAAENGAAHDEGSVEERQHLLGRNTTSNGENGRKDR